MNNGDRCDLLFIESSLGAGAAQNAQDPHGLSTSRFRPYKVMGNIYFVGTEELGSFLITTPEGNILINSDFESTVPQIRASVEKLGFKFSDIKILLGSHAHGDHMEGDALVKELTGSTGGGDGAGRSGAQPHDAAWANRIRWIA